ncbi:YbaN family protein [Sneathiella sp. CAU 1612]|uniref:YbaN family protein n=1 Tax=Sneathiella sedimenti TaxID=2816034 RepID=A0ABS3F4C9_9PROT|nr:YbaN family protein [Sneathiella sedimenti]MBO0333374.1 YbaN family protein [Sneathiella sedimenti]
MTAHTKKIVLLLIGWLFVFIGGIGIFLPVLPTTPFLLISLWAFSQSSERFHDWLYNHRIFGPPLQDWSKYGVIPLRAKIVALATMAISATLVIIYSSTPWYALGAMILLMGIGAGFILSRPSRPREKETP